MQALVRLASSCRQTRLFARARLVLLMKFKTALFTFFAAVASACAGEELTSDKILQAIRDLSSRKFAVRQEATDFLWRAGESARPALLEALKSDDREVVFRARKLLERLRYGIRIDTPKNVVRLIREFLDGSTLGRVCVKLPFSDHRAIS